MSTPTSLPEHKQPAANYSVLNWLAQRVTAALMALFTLVLLAQFIFAKGPMGYYRWASLFAPGWMKALTVAVILALLYHVWLGMRDIWMDYIKPAALRLALQVFVSLWLAACAAWAFFVLWRF